MSFILDALRKSEHERQRAAMPGIAQVPFGLPRRQMPAWPIAVIVVLAIAVLALGGAWWRSARQEPVAAADPPASPARTEIPLTLPPAAVATLPIEVFSAPPVPERAGERSAATSDTPAPAPTQPADNARQPTFATDATAEPTPAADEPTLPSADALAAEGVAVPPLRLELHAYSPRPADRFVFINGTKYLEGATLAEGPRIVTIAPNGAVLTYLGYRFLLAPQ
jgi:general secretion pathway protein B